MLPVKKPGPYQFRVAVRDPSDGKVGSASQFVEVPDLKKAGAVVSGIVLDSFSAAEWQQISAGKNVQTASDPLDDTSLRRFKGDTVIRYGFEVYNAKLDASRKPALSTKIRVFRDGKLVLDGQQLPLELLGQTDMAH